MVALLRETLAEFQRHKAQWLGAAIAYYALFAIAPLIIVVVEVAGIFLGRHQAALDRLYDYLSSTAGRSAAGGVRAIVTATFSQRRSGLLSQVLAWTLFVIGAAGLFGALQQALNTIWDVTPSKRTLRETLRTRLFSFLVVVAVAVLLVLSVLINSALTLDAMRLSHAFPAFPASLKAVDFVVSAGLVTVLFAVIYGLLPDCHVPRRDVWLGAAVSAGLFVLGQFVLGWYLGRVALSSGYGSFGGIVVFIVWVNYSAQIALFGAEFTHVYSKAAEPSLETVGDADSFKST